MSDSRREFRPADLQEGDLIVVENPLEAYLVLEVNLAKDSSRKVRLLLLPTHKHSAEPEIRILRADFVFPLHYQLLCRDRKTSKLEEIK